MRLKLWTLTILAFALALPFALSRHAVAADGTWDQIAKTGVVRIGVIPNRPPYFWQENEQWVGFSAQMGRDVAAALSIAMEKEIKPEFVITSFTTVILDMQANKVDTFFGLSFSEERKKAIQLAGPIYELPSVVINAKSFAAGDKWADYDKPPVKVAVVMGTTDEQVARKFLPSAEIRSMKGTAEAILDIQSGNSNAMVTTPLTALGALKANKSLGELKVLQPVNNAPSYGGTRRDGDGRFGTFLQGWTAAYKQGGRAQLVILDAMKKFGLDTAQLPKEVRF